jgi:hypothetical protein
LVSNYYFYHIKLLLLEIEGGESYAAAWPVHHEIPNIFKAQWIVRVDLIVNILCYRRDGEFCVLLIRVIYVSYTRPLAYPMSMLTS